REYLVAIYLTARKKLITTKIISIGTLTANLIHPRELFKPALEHNAASVVIAHNHPSGDTTPSDEDILVTENLVRSGNTLDIKVNDHLIITKDDYFSFKDEDKI
ncbi:MAG: hypothetical protein HOE40_02055, partial [Candidatus Pacebacteria bacterium]|nr:hypothetical protein [Candidatus Paceibacterota bacterium]